jgi:hypothetical protein
MGPRFSDARMMKVAEAIAPLIDAEAPLLRQAA